MKRFFTWLIACLFMGQAMAEPQGMFNTSGKYNVVVAVLAIIFIGLVVYLVRLDLKLRKLEDKE